MSKSYDAILKGGRIRWLDEVPEALRRGRADVQVSITVREPDEDDPGELSALLEDLAARNPFRDIDDPVAWQRRRRQGEHRH